MKEGDVTAEELIDRVCERAPMMPRNTPEAALQNHMCKVLEDLSADYNSQFSVCNPPCGKSKIDFYVECDGPGLLIELKATGDWKQAANATWQLFQASTLLGARGIGTMRLLICGGPIKDRNLFKFLRSNDVSWVIAGAPSNG